MIDKSSLKNKLINKNIKLRKYKILIGKSLFCYMDLSFIVTITICNH